MYENYKIRGDGTPKYDGEGYHVAPERRLKESSEEWNRRLKGNPGKLRRRKPQKKSSGLKVKHIVYLLIFFAIVLLIDIYSDTDSSKSAMKNQSNTLPAFNLKINGTSSDFGNDLVHPSDGNKFIYVNTNLENLSDDVLHIDPKDFTLICNNNQSFKPTDVQFENNNFVKDVNPHSNVSQNIVFEIPVDYSGDIRLEFNNSTL